ncbi:MAG TPA: serine/threonine-protein kinase [Chloroflexaceae bacterium]|nr:serine/threonine-protein kinase [Chloroflexaceae bacterium]
MLAPDTLLQQRYRITHAVGAGGMGQVYAAADTRFGHAVAIKHLPGSERGLSQAFAREAKLMAGLAHPALPKMLDYFEAPEGQFLVMEFVAGDDLGAMLERRGRPFPTAQVLAWADQILDVLAYLHGQPEPVVHRDLKPANLKLTPEGRVMLLDFGLAKGTAAYQTRVADLRSVMGYTPQYAPLEQLQGSGTDPRSDLYALAASLFTLLTGRMPPAALERLGAMLEGGPDPLPMAHALNRAVPEAVSAALTWALAMNPGRRPESARAMQEALRRAGAAVEVRRPRPWLLPALGGLALTITVVLVVLLFVAQSGYLR